MRRFFEILPGSLSWGFLIFLTCIIFLSPALGAVFIIAFDLYWLIRVSYLTMLLVMAHLRLHQCEKTDWLALARGLQSPHGSLEGVTHLIFFPTYQEPPETLEASVSALSKSTFNLKQMVVVLATEERAGDEFFQAAEKLAEKYQNTFRQILITRHPDGLEGEARVKGANTSWAAKKAKEWCLEEGIDIAKVITSCFDADTVCHPHYFACLTYSFLKHPNPHRASFQPIPIYHNNIWYAPSFARVIEVSSSFWQLIQSMRHDRLVTFSSHSMSFKTLCEIDFWPRDMISDDSAIFWRALLHFDGDYHVVPLSVTVSMDVAYEKSLTKSFVNQYKQKRRWAWGVENIPVTFLGFLKTPRMPLRQKIKRTLQLLEEHFTWATWAPVLFLIGPLPILLGSGAFQDSLVGYNLPIITRFLLGVTSISLVICIIASFSMLPPKPDNVPKYRIVTMCTQWLLIPPISAILGSIPALDAQTRLLLNKPLNFWVTPKGARQNTSAPKNREQNTENKQNAENRE